MLNTVMVQDADSYLEQTYTNSYIVTHLFGYMLTFINTEICYRLTIGSCCLPVTLILTSSHSTQVANTTETASPRQRAYTQQSSEREG